MFYFLSIFRCLFLHLITSLHGRFRVLNADTKAQRSYLSENKAKFWLNFFGTTFPRGNIGIPCFLKVRIMQPHFYEKPTLVPVFTNRKKTEEDFRSYEKRLRVKIAFSICYAAGEAPSRAHAQQLH